MSAIDGALLEISRVIEAVFDEIEYRQAKAARARAAKPTNAFRSFRMSPLVVRQAVSLSTMLGHNVR